MKQAWLFRWISLIGVLLLFPIGCGSSQPAPVALSPSTLISHSLSPESHAPVRVIEKEAPHGTIRMGPADDKSQNRSVIFSLNIPKAVENPGFKTQSIDTTQVAFLKVWIKGSIITNPLYPAGTLSDPDPAKDKLIVNPGQVFTVQIDNVPYGDIRLATILFYDAAKNALPGAEIQSVFKVAAPLTIVEINFKTTPTGQVIDQVLTANPTIATAIDQTLLQNFIDTLTGVAGVKPNYTYTTHPLLIKPAAIAADLLANGGDVTLLNPLNPAYKVAASTIQGSLSGLVSTDTALVRSSDPGSPVITNAGNGAFTVNKVIPGSWVLNVEALGYTVTGAPVNVTVAEGGTFNVGTILLTPATPTISSLSVASGLVGSSIQINGTNFHTNVAGNVVKFSGVTATVTAATPTQLTVTVPGGLSGVTSVSVSIGTQISNSLNFEIKPVITGVASNGTIINGTGFSTTPANNSVLYNGLVATVNTATNTQLNVTVPGGVVGTVPLTVAVGSQTSDPVMVNLALFPTITSLSVGNAMVGSNLQINGTSFDPTLGNNIVKFGTQTAVVNSGTLTQLDVTVPGGISGTVGVTVTIGSNQSNSINFDVQPSLTSLSVGNARIGDSIQINGKGFSTVPANNTVKVGGVNAVVNSATNTLLDVTVPAGLSGSVGITAQVGTQISNSLNLDVSPEITSLSATNGTIGSVLLINGTGFSTTPANNTVKFGTQTATVNTATLTQLNVTVPAAIVGTVGVTVQVGTQTSNSTNFDVKPNLTSLSVTNGVIGSNILINGTGFSTTLATNTVKFGTVNATVNTATATQLNVTVPAAIVGTVGVTVQIGTQTSNSINFDVTPQINSLSSGSGSIGTGITINGTGFSTTLGNNTVKFNGVSATVTAATATQLTVTVPTAANGNITVQVGTQTSNGSAFNVLPLITLSSPTGGAIINGITAVSATVTSGNAVTQVEFFDGAVSIGVDTTFPYSINWNTTLVASGAHTLTAKVTDAAANLVVSSGVAVTVNQPPTIASLTATINPLSGLKYPVQLLCTASDVDNALVAGSYTWSTDSGTFGTFSSPNGNQVYWTAPATAGGPYTIRCSVSDGVNPATQQTVVIGVNSGSTQLNLTGGF